MTLDGVERTLTADDLLICDANDAPIGARRHHGRRRHRDHRRHHVVALEVAWFEPSGITPTGRPPRPAVRGVGPVRARRRPVRHRPRRSPASSSCCARRAPTWSCTPARSTPAAPACPPPDRRARCARPGQPVLGTALDRRRHRRRCSTRSGSTRGAATATCSTVGAAVVAPRLRPRRSTSSRRSPASSATTRLGRTVPELDRCTAPCRRASSDRRRSARCCSGSALTEAMPNPFLAPGDLARAGLPAEAITHRQPARRRGERAAHVAAARVCCKAVALQRVAPPRRASRCSRSVTSTRPATAQPLPDEREVLCVALAGRRRPRRRGGVARARRGPRRRRAASTVRSRARRAAPDAVGRAAGGRRTSSVPSARSTPTCADAFGVGERVAWLEVDLDASCWPGPGLGRSGSRRQPVPVERHRPGLRGRPTPSRPRSWTRRIRRPRATCWSISRCSTSTAARASPTGGRSLA